MGKRAGRSGRRCLPCPSRDTRFRKKQTPPGICFAGDVLFCFICVFAPVQGRAGRKTALGRWLPLVDTRQALKEGVVRKRRGKSPVHIVEPSLGIPQCKLLWEFATAWAVGPQASVLCKIQRYLFKVFSF